MTLGDVRVGWRVLAREPGYSAALVAALAIGFAVCFLLLGFTRYSMRYNAHLADVAHIYVVKERNNVLPRPEWRARAPTPLVASAIAAGPGHDATSAKQVDLVARVGPRLAPLRLGVAAPNYLRFFGIRAVAGDADAALARPDALVLSRSEAERLFGQADALGMVAHIEGVPFTVAAILPDMPGNTTVDFAALVGAGAHGWDAPRAERPADPWRVSSQVYIKLAPGSDAGAMGALLQDEVTGKLDARFMNAAWRKRFPDGRLTEIGMAPLADVYFDEDLLRSRAGARYGNKTALAGLAALGLLILLLACTNYVNLAAVRTTQRQREIGVRKVLGAGQARLLAQFVAEAMLVALLGAALGMLLAWLATPLFAQLVERPLSGMFDAALCFAALAAALLVGTLSALYPAWLAWRVAPKEAMHGRAGSESASALAWRRALSVFQCGAAVCLIGVTLAVSWQTRYASRADPGFDAAPLLVLDLPDNSSKAARAAFLAALARLPGVQGAAPVSEAIGRDRNTVVGMVQRADGVAVPIELKAVGADFFRVIGVAPAHGRVFDTQRERAGSDAVILNALGAQALGFASPEAAVGQMLGQRRIVGIAPDLRYRSLRQQAEAMMYVVSEDQDVLTVRAASPDPAGMAALRAAIDSLWAQHFPNALIGLEAASSVFAQNYAEDLRLATMLACASAVATLLASFGIYVLTAYSVRRRAREFVLRKLHGARGADIGRLVLREFLALVGMGVALGLPLAWLGIERYLSAYVERAPMGSWPLLAALALVAAVALAASSRHTVGAMRVSPALALRS